MPKLMQNMTEGELEAVEVDKARWLDAWKMYKTWGGKRIVIWLEANKGKPDVEDMRRRLNIIRNNNKSK